MPIRRRITATIDEIDDSADSRSPTNFPVQPAVHPPSDAQPETPFELPGPGDESETHPSYGSRFYPPTVGRTLADLVVEFKNDYRAMAVLLTVVPIVIFAAKLDSMESLKYPLSVAVILNVIWFGSPVLLHHFTKSKRHASKT